MLLILFCLLFLGCEKVVLKKGDRVPFKISQGSYTFDINKLEYPKTLKEKEEFLDRLEDHLSKILLEGRRAMIMLDEEFLKDLLSIKSSGLLQEEYVLKKSASTLIKEERESLFSILEKEVEKYRDQDILNMQIEYILNLLGRNKDFDGTKRYTELFKERALEDLSKNRGRIVSILKNRDVELFISLNSIYNKFDNREFEYKKFYYTKDVRSKKGSNFIDHIKEYEKSATIVIEDLEEKDFNRIISSESSINSKRYVLSNSEYKGYIDTNGSVIYLIGGEKEIFTNSSHKVFLNIEEIDLNTLDSVNDKNITSDLFKTKSEIEREKEERELLKYK